MEEVVEKTVKYKCQVCGRTYVEKDDCRKCEERHGKRLLWLKFEFYSDRWEYQEREPEMWEPDLAELQFEVKNDLDEDNPTVLSWWMVVRKEEVAVGRMKVRNAAKSWLRKKMNEIADVVKAPAEY